MPTLSSTPRPADLGPLLWKQIDAYVSASVVAGMLVSGAPRAFELGGLWPWAWGVVGAGAVLSAAAQRRRLRASLVGPARVRVAPADADARAG